MSAARLIELRERKRLLVLQADLHRAVLRSGCVMARDRLSWLNQAREKAGAAGPWLAAGAGAAGLIVAWRGRKLVGWIPTVLSAWRAIRSIKSK